MIPKSRASRYHSLLQALPGSAHPEAQLADLFPVDRAPAFFRHEASRLQALKASLWSAFTEETVEATAPLVELTTAYTGALGLQLDMIDRASVVAKTGAVAGPEPGRG